MERHSLAPNATDPLIAATLSFNTSVQTRGAVTCRCGLIKWPPLTRDAVALGGLPPRTSTAQRCISRKYFTLAFLAVTHQLKSCTNLSVCMEEGVQARDAA